MWKPAKQHRYNCIKTESDPKLHAETQLGYPTKNALRNWYREYQQHQDLRVRCAARAPKFSEAQKQAALEHYRTHDRSISATMRALGYPGRGTLTAWVREAFPETRISMVGRSWRPAYPDALKQASVLDLCSGEESAQQIAERLGVCRPTLYAWRNELLGQEAASSMKRATLLRQRPNAKNSSDSLKLSSAMSDNCSLNMIC